MPKQGYSTAMARARGLGASGSGVRHWWWQRLTAVALVPLMLWFVAALIAVAGDGHQALVAWLSRPLPAIVMIALLIMMFWHLALGLIVIAEDYLHRRLVKVAVVAAIQLGCLGLTVAAVTAVLLL